MRTKKYFSKYYKGEQQAPKTLSQKGAFFWNYEKSFYDSNPNPTKEDFEQWLDDLLCNYLPYKMMSAPIADEAKVIQEWKDDYANS